MIYIGYTLITSFRVTYVYVKRYLQTNTFVNLNCVFKNICLPLCNITLVYTSNQIKSIWQLNFDI